MNSPLGRSFPTSAMVVVVVVVVVVAVAAAAAVVAAVVDRVIFYSIACYTKTVEILASSLI